MIKINDFIEKLEEEISKDKKYVRKVILRNGRAVNISKCTGGDIIICLFLNNRNIFWDINEKRIIKQVYLDNPIHLIKTKII